MEERPSSKRDDVGSSPTGITMELWRIWCARLPEEQKVQVRFLAVPLEEFEKRLWLCYS